jgi:hypothetical protein
VPPALYPDCSCLYEIVVVQPEGNDRCSPRRRQANDVSAAVDPGEVIAPLLVSGIEQFRQLSGL